MAVVKSPVRQQSYLTEYDKLLAEQLRQMSGSIGPGDIAAESYGGKFPVGTMTAKILGSVLARGAGRRASNREEQSKKAQSLLAQIASGNLPQNVTMDEFGNFKTMTKEGRIIPESSEMLERPTYGMGAKEKIIPEQNIPPEYKKGLTLQGTESQPNFFEKNIQGYIGDKNIKNKADLITAAGYDPMEYNLYERQLKSLEPKNEIGNVSIMYDNDGKEIEVQTVKSPNGNIKIFGAGTIGTDNPIEYSFNDLTSTPPKAPKIKWFNDDKTGEIIAIDENNIDNIVTVRPGITPKNYKVVNNQVIDMNNLDSKTGQAKIIFDGKDKDIIIDSYIAGGKTHTIAKDKNTGNIVWQSANELERIINRPDGSVVKIKGDDASTVEILLEPIEDKDSIQITNAPNGDVYFVNKDTQETELLFKKEPGFTWKEFYDNDTKQNVIAKINDENGEIIQKLPAKKDSIKSSQRDLKIQQYMDQFSIDEAKAIKIIDGQIKIESDGELFYEVDIVDGTKKLISNSDINNIESANNLINNEEISDRNLTNISKESNNWLVPRKKDIQPVAGTRLSNVNILANTAKKGMEDIYKLYKIVKKEPSYIGKIGALNRQAQGASGLPIVGSTIKSIYGGVTGIDLNDQNLQEVNRLIRSIETALTAVATAKGFRDPSQSRIEDVSTKLNLEGLLTTGASALPALKAEFNNLNNQYMNYQSMNRNNTMIEDYSINPNFAEINNLANKTITIRKKYNPETGKFEIIRQ